MKDRLASCRGEQGVLHCNTVGFEFGFLVLQVLWSSARKKRKRLSSELGLKVLILIALN